MNAQKKKKKKEEKKNPLDDVPPYLRFCSNFWSLNFKIKSFHIRDFISSIALKEEPESPGTMRKKAQAKRKQAQEGVDDSAQIKKMMSGVNMSRDLEMKFCSPDITLELPIHRLGDYDSVEQFQNRLS